MYKEVAIDPECMAEFHYYALIKREFGFDKGRYAAVEIKQWAQAAFHFARESDMQPIKKKSVTNFLNKIRQGKDAHAFLLVNERAGVDGENWNSWWELQKKNRDFSVSVSENNLDGTINHDAILGGCEEWEIPASISIDRNANDIVAVIEPLIYLSKNILIIDSYFRFTDNDTLKQLLVLMGTSSVSKITIVTSMETLNPQDIYENEYRDLNTSSIEIEWVHIVSKYFHERYIISDVGAMRVGQGFMPDVVKGTHADRLKINIVSTEEAQGVHDALSDAFDRGVAEVILRIN